MQIIEKMEDDRFENICDAGVELVQSLIEILKTRGLDPSDALPVVAIAMAGIAKGSKISTDHAMEAVEVARPFWRNEMNGEENGIVFDPAHRRSDYVAPARDITAEN